MQAVRGIAAKTAPNTKELVKLKKYRHDSTVDRRTHSFKRFEPCYRQLYPCRRIKTFRSRTSSKNGKGANGGQQINDFQRSQSMPNFQFPPLYKCKRRIQESRSGVNLERGADRELPSWLLPLYECKAKRSEPIEAGNYPSRYRGVALHKKLNIRETMKQIKLKQISLNQEITEKWSTYYDSPGKKQRNKREHSSARVLMAVDELKRRIGKMQERNKIFKQALSTQTSAHTKRGVSENRTISDPPMGEIDSSAQCEVEEKIKIIKQSADEKGGTQSSKKLLTDYDDSSSHACTSCSQKQTTFNQDSKTCSMTIKEVDHHQAKEINANLVLDKREPKKSVQRNRNDLEAGASINLMEENKVGSSLDPSKLKERIRQWKLENDKENTSDPVDSAAGSFHFGEKGSTIKDKAMHQKQSVGLEEDPLISYKPFIVCKTVNKVGKRSLSSLPTFRVIPHKASTKGPFVVIKRNFSVSRKHSRAKRNWFDVIKLHRKVDNTAADDAAMIEKDKPSDPQKVSSENPGKPELPANEISERPKENSSFVGFKKNFGVDIEKKLEKANSVVINKPWLKDLRTRNFRTQHPQSSKPPSIMSDHQQEQVNGYTWVSNNKDILEEIKQEKQHLNYKPLVPDHVKASILEFKLPLKAQIADYRKRNESKKVHSSLHNRSISYRRYTNGKMRALFSTNFPPESDILSLNSVFSNNPRFLNTSSTTNTSNSSSSSRSKSEPEILVSSDLYKHYVLRPIYGGYSKNNRKTERNSCEFSSWATKTATDSRLRPAGNLASPNLPIQFSDDPPRSLKKQVEELKCLIKKSKISNHIVKSTSVSKLPQHIEDYQQRLNRLIRAAEETAKNMDIPEPRRSSFSKMGATNISASLDYNIGPSSTPKSDDVYKGSPTDISTQTLPRKQQFFNLVLKLKSVVGFVGRRASLLPTKVAEKHPFDNDKTEDKKCSRSLPNSLEMSGLSHSNKLNAKISSSPTKEKIATLQKTLSELNTFDMIDCSSSHQIMKETSKDLAICEKAKSLNDLLKSRSTSVMAAPQSNHTQEALALSSVRASNESVQPSPAAGSTKPPPAPARSASSFIGSDPPKIAHLNTNKAVLPVDVTKHSITENPYRRTSPSKEKIPSLAVAHAPEPHKVGSQQSPKNIGGKLALGNPVDEIHLVPDQRSSKMPHVSKNDVIVMEEHTMSSKLDLKQVQYVPKTPSEAPLGNVNDHSQELEDVAGGSNKIQSEANIRRQSKITNEPNSRAGESAKALGDQMHDGKSMHHSALQPQLTVEDISLQQNFQSEPLTGTVNNNFVYAPIGNTAQEQISPALEDRYLLDGAQYTACPDCGRIYPVFCACRASQDDASAQIESVDIPSLLSRYFPKEHEIGNSNLKSSIEYNTTLSHQFSEKNMHKDYGYKAPTNCFLKTNFNSENSVGNAERTYVRRERACSEILGKEPFINPDALKKLKLPVNFDEEVKETTWYNATDTFPRL